MNIKNKHWLLQLYGDLPISDQCKLNRKAYSDYCSKLCNSALTFNQWFLTDTHKKFLIPNLRKIKLEKINNAD